MIDKMNITSAKYLKEAITNENCSIKATVDGQELSVPICVGNRHYDEIKRQADAGTLTIQAAD
jgi:hypothetical protein